MIDPSIALQYHPVEIQNPLQIYAQIQSLKHLAQQQQLGEQQLAEAKLALQMNQRKLASETALGNYLSSAGAAPAAPPVGQPVKVGNYEEAPTAPAYTPPANAFGLGTLLKVPNVMPADAFALRKSVQEDAKTTSEIDKNTAEAETHTLENRLKTNTAVQAKVLPVLEITDPTAQAAAWKQASDELVADGTITKEYAALHPYPGSPEAAKRYAVGLNAAQASLIDQQKQRAAASAAAAAASKQTLLDAQRKNASTVLASVGPALYPTVLAQLTKDNPDAVKGFPETWDRDTLLALGSTPAEQVTAAQTKERDKQTAHHQTVEENQGQQRVNIEAHNSAREDGKVQLEQGALKRLAHDLAQGRLTDIRQLVSLRGDQRLIVDDLARQENPKYNPDDVKRQLDMEDWAVNGKGADNLQSFGTFLQHAGSASDAVNKIRLTGSPYINKPLNWWRSHMTGDPNFTTLMGSIEPVRKEAENFLLNGHAQQAADKKAAEVVLDDNSTPAQFQAAFKVLGHTALARATEINYRYKKVRNQDLQNPFSPEAIAGAQKIGITGLPGTGAPAPASPTAPAAAPPKPAAAPAGSVSVTDPNGSVHVFANKAAADAFKKMAGIQ
jgi:hypothetical protein